MLVRSIEQSGWQPNAGKLTVFPINAHQIQFATCLTSFNIIKYQSKPLDSDECAQSGQIHCFSSPHIPLNNYLLDYNATTTPLARLA